MLEGNWVGGSRGNQVEVLFKSLKKGKALASSIQLALETSPHLHLLVVWFCDKPKGLV